jgi:hypothetical protein
MRGLKSKIIAISFLLLLLAPAFGLYIWLELQKELTRHQVKELLEVGLEDEALTLFKFTNEGSEQLEWEHSKEFKFDGKMYDVVRQEEHGDTTYYYCWEDHKESEIYRQTNRLIQVVQRTDPDRKERQDRLVNFYKNLFCSDVALSSMTLGLNQIKIHPKQLLPPKDFQSSPSSPPPKHS